MKYAIVFFDACKEEKECKPWPKSPKEVVDEASNLHVMVADKDPGVPPMFFEVPFSSDMVKWYADLNSMTQAMGPCQCVYTVHPKGVLLPLLKWAAWVEGNKEVQMSLQDLGRKTYDLCEVFYYPAILPWETRANFGPDVLRHFLNLDPSTNQMQTLFKLVELSI
jgi:hypothetical protein